uniref:Pentacotripeptide-repeat region of PRORP domain-containing protein n=1 Tax=Oryza meridionalis TaxID=40149 RepID=A0A0E0EQZ8_9ORYZ
MHGRGEDALSLFAGMQRAGVTPNEVTLLGVLTACCHAGLIEEGLQQLDAMRRNEIDKKALFSFIGYYCKKLMLIWASAMSTASLSTSSMSSSQTNIA